MTTKQKQTALVELTRLSARVESLKLRVLAAADDIALETGARSTAAWLADTTRDNHGTVLRSARLAAAVDDRYRHVGAALADGRVNLAQAHVITTALDALPGDLDPTLRAKGEHTWSSRPTSSDPASYAASATGSWKPSPPTPPTRPTTNASSPRNAAPTPPPDSPSSREETAPPTCPPGSPTTSPTGSAPTWTPTPHPAGRPSNGSGRGRPVAGRPPPRRSVLRTPREPARHRPAPTRRHRHQRHGHPRPRHPPPRPQRHRSRHHLHRRPDHRRTSQPARLPSPDHPRRARRQGRDPRPGPQPTTLRRPASAPHSTCSTTNAPPPAAPSPPPGAKHTTRPPGPPAARPASKTAPCSAPSTTTAPTTPPGT